MRWRSGPKAPLSTSGGCIARAVIPVSSAAWGCARTSRCRACRFRMVRPCRRSASARGPWASASARAAAEIAALARGFDLGMTLVDTAEMYGDGGAEEIVGASDGRPARPCVRSQQGVSAQRRPKKRDRCLRAQPRTARHGSARSLSAALARARSPSAKRWTPSSGCGAAGKILRWGVSNFDTADMRELFALAEGRHCATNQVLYHLAERGIEWELLPWMRERRIPMMAYSPLGQGSLLRKRKLAAIAHAPWRHPGASRVALGRARVGRHGHSGIGRSRTRPREP